MSGVFGFVIAPPSERILTVGQYLVGAAELAVVLAALAFGAYRVRAWLLPGWWGAPARLVEIVTGTLARIWISEALGTFGAFEEAPVIATCIVVSVGGGLLARRAAAGRGMAASPESPVPESSSVAKLIALGVCAALAAAWVIPSLSSIASGMDRTDTLWYHMPLATRFVQTGHLGSIFFFDPIFLASFYPANSEVFHAVPILFLDRDILSPLINLGWLSAALLACWCIGRPYGVAPQALIGGSVVLGSQSLVEFQAGEALNDITGLAFLLAAIAILVNGYATAGRANRRAAGVASPRVAIATGRPRPSVDQPSEPVATRYPTVGGDARRPPENVGGRAISTGALIVAGLAAGVAAGVKLSFLGPVGVLTIGVIAIAARGRRLVTAAAWAIPALAAGGYWYARNLFAVGNPIPYIQSIGPISLPAPARDFQLRPGFTVAHYWNDPGVWKDWFVPGLHSSFGDLWPLTIAGLVAVGVFALWRGREPVLRLLGAFALLTAVAYAFTPLTAAGEPGQPIAFAWNLRYLAPAVAVSLAILPCLPAARATLRRRAAVLIALTVLAAVTMASLVQWRQGHTKGALAAAAAVLLVAAIVAWLRHRGYVGPASRRRVRVALAAVVLAVAVASGYAEERHYLAQRYGNTVTFQDLDEAFAWARDVRDARIAVGGIRGVFNQYAFYGTDLSNHVQWLGTKGPHDAYLRIPDCRTWREAVDDGDFTHVVTTFDPYLPGGATNSPEGRWTESDPNAKVVVREGPVRVFELTGPLDPGECKGQKPLSKAQLHRVPNLTTGTPLHG